MSFPAYPQYKDSGIETLGEIPGHWDVTRLPYVVFDNNAGEVIDKNFWGDGSELLYTCAKQPLLSDYKDFPVRKRTGENDLLLTRNGTPYVHLPIQGSIYSNVVQRVSLIPSMDRNFMRAALDVATRDLVGYGVSIASFNYEMWTALRIPLPVCEEQIQIARFLDHETARIDALIEEQQRLIELLKEKRQAVISHAVTKGLDPTVPMKDSGVEWLGEVPANWKVSKLGHYAQILTGFPFPSASFSHDESDVRLLRGANIGVGSLKWIDTVYWNLGEGDSLSSYLMGEGQIVLGMDRPWISEGMRIARVTQEDMPCLLLQRVAAITPSAELDDEYLFCLLASELFKTYVEPDLTGVSVPHISPEQIMSFQISVPEIDEQRRISSYIRNQLDQMSALFEQASESVELLQERRSALISAAVTGKIDVRGWQPPARAQAPVLEAEAV